MSRPRHRRMGEPFVVAPPAGARIRTRLRVSDEDDSVLRAVGEHLGHLASADLARRCAQGRLDPRAVAISRRERKQSLTKRCSSLPTVVMTTCSHPPVTVSSDQQCASD